MIVLMVLVGVYAVTLLWGSLFKIAQQAGWESALM
jgi:hypothetical protein